MSHQHALISTWKMSYQGHLIASQALIDNAELDQAIIQGIVVIENDENIHSVGYGGWPDINGEVCLDAAFMNGSTFGYGAISAVKGIKNPIKVAHQLAKRELNCFLTAAGAEAYAIANNFDQADMLSPLAYQTWLEKRKVRAHDTVCFIGKNKDDMMTGVSTSGLFLKEKGRVGDSPIIGSGYYVDSKFGGCAATGIGENIMRGCLSFNVVTLLRMKIDVQTACEQVINEHIARLIEVNIKPDDISLIALDKDGNFGVATTKDVFPFVYSNEQTLPTIMLAHNKNGKMKIEKASTEWLAAYDKD